VLTLLFFSAALHGDPVAVRHPQGSAHGFVVLKTLTGNRIATGDMTQIVHGNQVTARLIFRFRDGSVDDDTTVFVQSGTSVLLRIIMSNAVRLSRNPSTC